MKITCLIFSLIIFISERASAQQEDLTGQWELNVDKSIAAIEGSAKTRYDSLNQERKERLKSTMSGRTFHFQEAGKFLVDWKTGNQAKTFSGTWAADETTTTVTITIDGKSTKYTYKFAEGSLLLYNTHAQGLFPVLVFSRQ